MNSYSIKPAFIDKEIESAHSLESWKINVDLALIMFNLAGADNEKTISFNVFFRVCTHGTRLRHIPLQSFHSLRIRLSQLRLQLWLPTLLRLSALW